MNASDGWDWELTDGARRQFDVLDRDGRERVALKLDEVVDDAWRDPDHNLEPLTGVPHRTLRIGPFRLGCRLDRDDRTVWVLRIKKRGGDAYRDDD